jgi:dihydroflavonol-4-reductase
MARTVFLTGITGFIGKHIARGLLDRGYFVLAGLNGSAARKTVMQALRGNINLDRLKFVDVDLTVVEVAAKVMRGAECLIHSADPWHGGLDRSLDARKIDVVEATERLFLAAQTAGVTRIILTSSMSAMVFRDFDPEEALRAEDWSDLDHPRITPEVKSKTLTERLAWDWADRHADTELTVISPGLVLGPPLDANLGVSLQFMKHLMSGSIRVLPKLYVPLVDVRDVAEMHLRALDAPATIGRRFIAAETVESLPELTRHLKKRFPDFPIPTRTAPRSVQGVLALFSQTVDPSLPLLDAALRLDDSVTRRILRLPNLSGREAAVESAAFLASRWDEIQVS